MKKRSKGRYPNLIIAGVNKAGTTSLFTYLAHHPDICSSSVKETCFFLYTRYSEKQPPTAEYLKYFFHCSDERYVMESTPAYFYGGRDVAEKLYALDQDTKVILILRNPVDRVLSFFKHKKSIMEIDRNVEFDEYLEKCRSFSEERLNERKNDNYFSLIGGLYSRYLRPWYDIFGESLRVVFFDDLTGDTPGMMKSLCDWLDLDKDIYADQSLFTVENKSIGYKNAGIHRAAIKLNDMLEKALRKNVAVKAVLRKVYYAVNGKEEKPSVDVESLEWLRGYYAESNKDVADFLKSTGCRNLPPWLD